MNPVPECHKARDRARYATLVTAQRDAHFLSFLTGKSIEARGCASCGWVHLFDAATWSVRLPGLATRKAKIVS